MPGRRNIYTSALFAVAVLAAAAYAADEASLTADLPPPPVAAGMAAARLAPVFVGMATGYLTYRHTGDIATSVKCGLAYGLASFPWASAMRFGLQPPRDWGWVAFGFILL
ncbi:hypothetical protein Pogu_2254 [Pyrobaculum oguniense TE7]|uniref:Uncharacterized protein n=1 Tax=Pyrobaculum oguniense (strain DSM 13380 / JCM 10595 / TE7) TaxID=698757 RepID=H6QD13_PYROT|nr:hypothetical protein Pogu_2254 [Pyrobaculum oguniense TE7]